MKSSLQISEESEKVKNRDGTSGITVKNVKSLDENDINGGKDNPLNVKFTNPDEEKKEDALPNVSFISTFRFSNNWERFLLFLGFASSVITGLCQPFNIMIFGDLTDTFVKGLPGDTTTKPSLEKISDENSEENFIDGVTNFAINNSILGAVMFFFNLWILRFPGYNVGVFLAIMTTRKILTLYPENIFRIRDLYFKSALRQDIGWYDLQQTGDFASRMAEDLTKLEEGLGEKTVMFCHFQVTFIACLVLAFVKGWELALVCLVSFPVTMVSMAIVGTISSKLAKQELSAYGKAGAIAEEVLSSMRTVVAFCGQIKEADRYKANLIDAKDINIKRGFFNGLGFGLLWFFIYSSYALAFWYGVGLVIDKEYKASTMVTVFFGVMMASMNFGISSPLIESFGIAKGAAAKIFSVIERQSPIDCLSEEGFRPKEMIGSINLQDVYFEYPSRQDVKVLQGLNLKINRGETVALVGSSGCGKSTCIQLIQRFYDPRQGSVLVDDINIKELNVSWLRNHIGIVGQEPVLFQTTVAENIRFGNDAATMEEIISAAKQANAHDFITKLPQGYDTLVGERGAQISGGQKQRIAIARALVKKPSILLLDEATSALDTSSEAKVQAALDKASKGRTTIIVAHRLSTIRNADKIVVLSAGVVVEQGTHIELMALSGHYHALVTAQVTHAESEVDDSKEEGGKLTRLMSVQSTASSAVENSDEVPTPMVTDYFDEKPKPTSVLEVLKVNSPEWPYNLIGTIASFFAGCAMPIFAVLFGDILGFLGSDDEDEVRNNTNIYCVYFVASGVAVGIATFLQIYMFGIAGEKLTMRLRGLAFEAMLRQEISWFDDKSNSTGALCARLSGEASAVQGATGQRVGTVIQSMATLVLGIGLSMYYEWRLGLVALAFAPVILVGNYLFRNVMTGETFGNQAAMEKSTKLAVEAVGNIRTVVGLGREQQFHSDYMLELLPAHRIALRNTHLRALVYSVARSIMFFAYATCMYYGGILVRDGETTYAEVLKVSQALIMGTVSIANAMAFAPNFEKGLTSASKIFHLLRRHPKIYDKAVYTDSDWVAEGNVQYAKVDFFYPTRPGTQVLRGLDLSITKGHTVALVGPSGCGKSTCIQLLERFYDPNFGIIHLDDRDISTVYMTSLRSQLGIVSQEPVLFDRTIAENIAYGDNSRDVPMADIMEAAKKANIHNFIVTLPTGYETRLGEKGTQLSGGQKQRVAIARALVRNPRVLLLDEATSALDTESEKVVQAALDKAKKGRTCITIAHRLSTIYDADIICVINNGIVAEMGTHKELLSQRGIYYKLHTLQSRDRSVR